MSRETRLLLATISVSALVLVVLSQFRFPDRPAIVAAPAPPLERLAASAPYDELSRIVAAIAPNIAPSLVVLQLASTIRDEPRALASVLSPSSVETTTDYVPGLRVGETTAIAALGVDAQLLGVHGFPDLPQPQLIVADAVRRLALVRVPPDPTGRSRNATLGELRIPTYVIVVEGSRAGLSFRPLFVGGSDPFVDPHWESPLVTIGAAALSKPGSLVFSLEGQFLGSVVLEEGTLAIAEAREVVTTADRLSALGSYRPFEAGISVQQLTPQLAAALGVEQGVVIADIRPDSPAADALRSADVVTTLNGQAVRSADGLLLELARQTPGGEITMTLVRAGETLSVSFERRDTETAESPPFLGLELENRRGVGTAVVAVAPGSAGAATGLRPGDVIVGAGTTARPTPAEFRKMVLGMAPGAYVALTVDRAGQQRVLAFGAISAAAEAGAPQ